MWRWKFSEAFLLHAGKIVIEGQILVLPGVGDGVEKRDEAEGPLARLVGVGVEAQGGIEVVDALQPESWERAVIVVLDDTAAAVGSGVAEAAVELAAPVVGLVCSQAGWVVPVAELVCSQVAPVALEAGSV